MGLSILRRVSPRAKNRADVIIYWNCCNSACFGTYIHGQASQRHRAQGRRQWQWTAPCPSHAEIYAPLRPAEDSPTTTETQSSAPTVAAASGGTFVIGYTLDLLCGQSTTSWFVAFVLMSIPNAVGILVLRR